MRNRLLIEFVTQDDHILKLVRGHRTVRAPVVPDLRLAEEAETRPLNDLRRARKLIGPEEHRGAEDSFECCDKSAIFFAALVHAEGVEHLRGGSKADRLAPLPHCQCRQEDRHDPVLTERKTIFRMTGDLQNELSIATLVQELIFRQSADRQTTENERPRG